MHGSQDFFTVCKKDSLECYYFHIEIYIITAKHAMKYCDIVLNLYRPSL